MSRKISLVKFIIVLIVLVFLECFLLLYIIPNFKKNKLIADENKYCTQAVCTQDKSSCYVFTMDKEGKTNIIWRGSCK